MSLGELGGECRRLKCTDNYTHLGTVRMAHAQACADLDRRADLARSVYRPLRSRILRNPELSVVERCHLLFSMVLSSYTHGLGTWSLTTATEKRKFRGHYMQFLRGAVRPLHALPCRRLEDQQVCAVLGALLPSEALAVSRIRAFSQVALSGSAFVKTALLREQVWLDAVCEDLAMLQTSAPTPSVKAFLQVPRQEMWTAWHFSARSLSHVLKRFRRKCVASRQPIVQAALAKARMHHQLSEAGCIYVKVPPASSAQRCFACVDCGQVFSTACACAAHRRSVHGHRARASFGFGSACQVCATQFWTHARLHDHLRRSEQWAQTYESSDIVEPESVAVEPPHKALPPMRLIGPQPWWASLRPCQPSDVPLPPNPDLNCDAAFGRFRATMHYTSFFAQWFRAVEAGYETKLQSYFESSAGCPEWHLAVRVTAALSCSEQGLFVQKPSAAFVGSHFILLGPYQAIKQAREWDLEQL